MAMTTNVKLHGQLVNYAKALGNYIKTVDLATRKYFVVMLPRQQLLYKQLLICWFILSLLFQFLLISYISFPLRIIFYTSPTMICVVVGFVVLSVKNDNLLL